MPIVCGIQSSPPATRDPLGISVVRGFGASPGQCLWTGMWTTAGVRGHLSLGKGKGRVHAAFYRTQQRKVVRD